MLRCMTLCAAAMVALLCLVFLGNGERLVRESDAQTSDMQGGLMVSSRTALSISGVYGYAGTKITFSSARDTSKNTVYLSLIINGETWNASKKLATGNARIDGHSNSLSIAEQDAVIALMKDLDLTDIALSNPAPPQEDFFYKVVLYLTEVPAEWPPPVIEVTVPNTVGSAPSSVETTAKFGSRTVQCSATKVSQATVVTLGNVSIQAACSSGGQEGVKYFGCRTKKRFAKFDLFVNSVNKCFNPYVLSGRRTSNCKGRCGINCGRRNGDGAYTKDCLDHDQCVTKAGSRLAPGCNDEAIHAADDSLAPWNCT